MFNNFNAFRPIYGLILAGILFGFSEPLYSQTDGGMAQFLASQQLVESGRDVYKIHCAGCHGIDAQGKGSTWDMLDPKPRNLVSGAYKFRSTSLGTLPTTADLIRTIEQGVVGASMPGFPLLSSQEKYALVAFIKSLRPDWKVNEGKAHAFPEVPLKIYQNKTLFLASAFRGSTLYKEGCATCHGVQGLGDGDGAEGLVDSDNQLLKPADLSLPYIKSGRRVQDVYKAIFTGLDGTPMPAFEGVYDEAQMWDLVSYVMFLRGRKAGLYEQDLELNASMAKAAESFGKNKKKSSNSKGAAADDSWN